MTPVQMIAAAAASGSPALQALVVCHLAAGRQGMAAVALGLSQEALGELDAAFGAARDDAAALGALVALLAMPGLDQAVVASAAERSSALKRALARRG